MKGTCLPSNPRPYFCLSAISIIFLWRLSNIRWCRVVLIHLISFPLPAIFSALNPFLFFSLPIYQRSFLFLLVLHHHFWSPSRSPSLRLPRHRSPIVSFLPLRCLTPNTASSSPPLYLIAPLLHLSFVFQLPPSSPSPLRIISLPSLRPQLARALMSGLSSASSISHINYFQRPEKGDESGCNEAFLQVYGT